MRFPRRMALTASTFLALTVPLGCNDSKPSTSSSTTEATVKGVVKIDGKLVDQGDIIFDPSNYQRQSTSRTAPIAKDGSYEIKTLVGDNSIKLGGAVAKKSPILQTLKRSYTVQSGENTFDFEGSGK